ncbi:MAG TPA: putative sugar nucleotidyl transferase [Tepidisphaeraceae bacterium]|jgi:UDP-N-acetylglucosamine diphosphorylase/glucosamine-1-phosphate N-acetyltransferase|nr:putative sugar nucleotidyl transferase [Tepidisphaeraceae bacterium]
MHLVIFEGVHWRTFAPLSLGRPVFMLATGMATLLEKQLRHTNPTRVSLWVRPELAEVCRRRIVPKLSIPATVNEPLGDEPTLLQSGRTLHFKKFRVPEQPSVVLDDHGVVLSALVHSPGLTPQDILTRSDRWLKIQDLPRADSQTRLVERLWDLIKWNEESLIEDHAQTRRERRPFPPGPYHMLEEENIWLGEGVRPSPGVVLDGSRGPVVIDHHAGLGPNSILQGPCYIGPYAQVSPLAIIRPGTSIGMMCKVGGEISNSILFGYTNKIHEGFLGDSYVGKWVNLGAATNTSNLKNTYDEISVPTPQGPVKTGRRFLGALIGDHAKTAIGTRLTAGSYLGFSTMLAISHIAPKVVPSFTFNTDTGSQPYRIDKAIEVMKAVFARRNRSWDADDDQIVRYVAQIAPEVEGSPH